MKRNVSLKIQSVGPDKLLLFLPIVLTLVGLVMITNASVVQAQNLFGDKFFFARQQLMWTIIGIFVFLLAVKIPYAFWAKIATPLFILTILFLNLVLTPWLGTSALGAQRWITIFGFNFQPSELAKLSLILFGAKLLDKKGKFLVFLASTILVCALVILEPDLGTSIIIATISATLLFVWGMPVILFILILPVLLGLLFLIISFSSYRKERFLQFLGGVLDPLAGSYHVKQVILALSSGGLLGVGLGQSRQKFLFLPEVTTDSIFGVMAEEIGFVGVVILIGTFIFLIGKILSIARHVEDNFAKLVAFGVGTWIGFQAFVNIAGVSATIPLTGVPLPFFSYGGSSLVITLLALGIVVNISQNRRVAK